MEEIQREQISEEGLEMRPVRSRETPGANCWSPWGRTAVAGDPAEDAAV